jgi:hypothetical protein
MDSRCALITDAGSQRARDRGWGMGEPQDRLTGFLSSCEPLPRHLPRATQYKGTTSGLRLSGSVSDRTAFLRSGGESAEKKAHFPYRF